jgi:hypothetical protein
VLRKYLVAAVVAVVALAAAAAAYALTAADSTFSARIKASPINSGTSSSPKSVKESLTLDGGLKPGKKGQPETTDKITIENPSEWKYRGRSWPSSQRCDSAKANTAKTNKGCPRKSKVGSGKANLLAGAPPLATPVKRSLNLTLHVIKNGTLGIWAQSPAGESPPIAQFIPSKVSGRKITFDIPPNLETPLNVKSSIDLLTASIGGSTTVKGEKVGIYESTKCSDRKWTYKVTFDTFTGNLSATVNVKCTA